MALVYTQFLKTPIPDSDEANPSYEQFMAMVEHQEKFIYMNHLMKNLQLGGGGTLTWNTGILYWTDDLTVPVFHWGRKILVRFGSESLGRNLVVQNGQAIVLEIPFAPGTNTILNFTALSQLDTSKANQWVAGWRLGDKLYLNGLGEVS